MDPGDKLDLAMRLIPTPIILRFLDQFRRNWTERRALARITLRQRLDHAAERGCGAPAFNIDGRLAGGGRDDAGGLRPERPRCGGGDAARACADDPHPRNTCRDKRGNPMFDLRDARGEMIEIAERRKARPDSCIRLDAFDSARGRETARLSFIVGRPAVKPTFRPTRTEVRSRTVDGSIRTVR